MLYTTCVVRSIPSAELFTVGNSGSSCEQHLVAAFILSHLNYACAAFPWFVVIVYMYVFSSISQYHSWHVVYSKAILVIWLYKYLGIHVQWNPTNSNVYFSGAKEKFNLLKVPKYAVQASRDRNFQ